MGRRIIYIISLALALTLLSCRVRKSQSLQSATSLEKTDSLKSGAITEIQVSDFIRAYIRELKTSRDSLELKTEELDTLGRVRRRESLYLLHQENHNRQSRITDSLALGYIHQDSLELVREQTAKTISRYQANERTATQIFSPASLLISLALAFGVYLLLLFKVKGQ